MPASLGATEVSPLSFTGDDPAAGSSLPAWAGTVTRRLRQVESDGGNWGFLRSTHVARLELKSRPIRSVRRIGEKEPVRLRHAGNPFARGMVSGEIPERPLVERREQERPVVVAPSVWAASAEAVD